MISRKKSLGLLSIMAVVLILIDRITKQLASYYLLLTDVDIIPGALKLHYVENTGAAFSILENKMVFFYIITPVFCALILWFYMKLPLDKEHRALRILTFVLLAGALGNFIDRITYQYVIDFIYFSLINFPVFNVADIYVTGSVVLLLFYLLFIDKGEEQSEKTEK